MRTIECSLIAIDSNKLTMILGCPIVLGSFQAAGSEVFQINEVEVFGVIRILDYKNYLIKSRSLKSELS